MPSPTAKRGYKIRKSDSALTVPGRLTFPQGSYVQPQFSLTPNPAGFGQPQIQPYQMSTGTQASGLSGQQGQGSALYPTRPKPLGWGAPVGYRDWWEWRGVLEKPLGWGAPVGYGPMYQPKPPPVTGSYYNSEKLNGTYTPPTPAIAVGNVGLPAGTAGSYYLSELGGDASYVNQTNKTPVLQPSQYVNAQGVVQQGVTPFGTNAYGERLDVNGNVWNPATATRDIYGGQFIQVGEIRWERVNGKLRRVQYGKGGKKTVIKGGGNSGNTQQQAQQVQQQNPSQGASAFVSFRA